MRTLHWTVRSLYIMLLFCQQINKAIYFVCRRWYPIKLYHINKLGASGEFSFHFTKRFMIYSSIVHTYDTWIFNFGSFCTSGVLHSVFVRLFRYSNSWTTSRENTKSSCLRRNSSLLNAAITSISSVVWMTQCRIYIAKSNTNTEKRIYLSVKMTSLNCWFVFHPAISVIFLLLFFLPYRPITIELQYNYWITRNHADE